MQGATDPQQQYSVLELLPELWRYEQALCIKTGPCLRGPHALQQTTVQALVRILMCHRIRSCKSESTRVHAVQCPTAHRRYYQKERVHAQTRPSGLTLRAQQMAIHYVQPGARARRSRTKAVPRF